MFDKQMEPDKYNLVFLNLRILLIVTLEIVRFDVSSMMLCIHAVTFTKLTFTSMM